ncbi:hypothetical protein [Cytobacillus sp. FSL R5-0596]
MNNSIQVSVWDREQRLLKDHALGWMVDLQIGRGNLQIDRSTCK